MTEVSTPVGDTPPGEQASGGTYRLRRVGPVRVLAQPNVTVALLFIVVVVVGTAGAVLLGPRLVAMVSPRLSRSARTVRPLLATLGGLGASAAAWAGLGVAGLVVGRWCYLPGAGLFDRRGARWYHALDWPHPIRTRSAHRIVTGSGGVRTASCSTDVLEALLGEPVSGPT